MLTKGTFMPLLLNTTELNIALNTEEFRTSRILQYRDTRGSKLAEYVVDNRYVLSSEEATDLCMDGRAMWEFIQTLTSHATRQFKTEIKKQTVAAVLSSLATLPEGPFFYAVRAMYKASAEHVKHAQRKNPELSIIQSFDQEIDSFVYYSRQKEAPELRTADERLKGLGRLALAASNKGPVEIFKQLPDFPIVDILEQLPGCSLVDPVRDVLLRGSVDVVLANPSPK